jgi:hypothetical protein
VRQRHGAARRCRGTCPASQRPIQGTRSDSQSRQAWRTRRGSRRSRFGPPGNPQSGVRAHGVFLVTTSWLEGTDEVKQATAAVRAAGVKHFIWSTLPDVEAISGGKFDVPHFAGKAKIDRIVKEAGFAHHTFVIAPFFYQNLVGPLAPQKQADGSMGWALPLDPAVRCIMWTVEERYPARYVSALFLRPDVCGSR